MLYEFTSLRRTAEPATPAVSTSDAKAHLRVTHSDEDTLIGNIVDAAVRHVEDACGRALFTQTWTLKLDEFPVGDIILPRPPVASVTSITYVDGDGATQTLSSGDYLSDLSSEPAAISPAYGTEWPTTREQRAAVTVVYVSGHTTTAAIPKAIRQAILLLVGHFYENREASAATAMTELPMAVDALLAPYRMVQI